MKTLKLKRNAGYVLKKEGSGMVAVRDRFGEDLIEVMALLDRLHHRDRVAEDVCIALYDFIKKHGNIFYSCEFDCWKVLMKKLKIWKRISRYEGTGIKTWRNTSESEGEEK